MILHGRAARRAAHVRCRAAFLRAYLDADPLDLTQERNELIE